MSAESSWRRCLSGLVCPVDCAGEVGGDRIEPGNELAVPISWLVSLAKFEPYEPLWLTEALCVLMSRCLEEVCGEDWLQCGESRFLMWSLVFSWK